MSRSTDLTHFLNVSGSLSETLTPQARSLVRRLGEIVRGTSGTPESLWLSGPACIKRTNGRRCRGEILGNITTEGAIHWRCSVCSDSGIITNWKDTLFDNRAEAAKRLQEQKEQAFYLNGINLVRYSVPLRPTPAGQKLSQLFQRRDLAVLGDDAHPRVVMPVHLFAALLAKGVFVSSWPQSITIQRGTQEPEQLEAAGFEFSTGPEALWPLAHILCSVPQRSKPPSDEDPIVVLDLSADEYATLCGCDIFDSELQALVRLAVVVGKRRQVRLSLGELEELMGYVGFNIPEAKSKAAKKRVQVLRQRLVSEFNRHS